MAGITNVRQALEENVINISDVPANIAWENIAWENVNFTPTTGTPWMRVTFFPLRQRPTDVTATGLKRIDANFIMEFFTPAGNGPKASEDLAEAAMAAYPPGTQLSSGGVNTQIEWAEAGSGAVFDSPWYAVSVTVKVKAFI